MNQKNQQEKKNCRLAIISFILGIFIILGHSLFMREALLAAICAVIIGHLALSKIKRSRDSLKGRGLAIAGLSIGYLAIIAFIAIIVLILFIGLVPD